MDYCRDFEIFFHWLVAEGIAPAPIKSISLEILEQLKTRDIVSFETHCSIRRENAKDTIARRIAALKSLFHYLSQIAEVEIAEQIAGRILANDEINSFREFVALSMLN